MDNNIIRTVIPPMCPEHHVFAIPIDAEEFYARLGNWSGTVVWVCPQPGCDHRVGSHPDYHPLGHMANGELRTLRIKVHAKFDQLWRNDPDLTRSQAYRVLSLAMDLPLEDTHIAGFTKEQCQKAIALLNDHFDMMNNL